MINTRGTDIYSGMVIQKALILTQSNLRTSKHQVCFYQKKKKKME